MGKFKGHFWRQHVIIGRKSGATAIINRKRLVTDGLGSVYGNICFAGRKNKNRRFKTGTKIFKLTNDPKDSVTLPGAIKHSEAEGPIYISRYNYQNYDNNNYQETGNNYEECGYDCN